jgi:hypothetical protein
MVPMVPWNRTVLMFANAALVDANSINPDQATAVAPPVVVES